MAGLEILGERGDIFQKCKLHKNRIIDRIMEQESELDGMNILISELGEENFIKLAIKGSFFFDPSLVKSTTENLSSEFEKSKRTNEIITNTEDLKNYIEKINNSNEKYTKFDNKIKKYIDDKLKESLKDKEKTNLQKINKFINILTKEGIPTSTKGFDAYKRELIDKLNYLKARYTTKGDIIYEKDKLKKGEKAIYEIDNKIYRVHIDYDNNRFVRDLIKDITGIQVSGGIKSDTQNIIISHVWGNAFDPRYFTSLWNIVLVPAWANSLMDKEDAPAGTLASKMRATYMRICTKLYKDVLFPPKQKPFCTYLIKFPEVKNPEEAIFGEYSFNIIEGEMGRDQTKPISIVAGTQEIGEEQNNQQS